MVYACGWRPGRDHQRPHPDTSPSATSTCRPDHVASGTETHTGLRRPIWWPAWLVATSASLITQPLRGPFPTMSWINRVSSVATSTLPTPRGSGSRSIKQPARNSLAHPTNHWTFPSVRDGEHDSSIPRPENLAWCCTPPQCQTVRSRGSDEPGVPACSQSRLPATVSRGTAVLMPPYTWLTGPVRTER